MTTGLRIRVKNCHSRASSKHIDSGEHLTGKGKSKAWGWREKNSGRLDGSRGETEERCYVE